jgi:cleavage stimulation factor subunit 3
LEIWLSFAIVYHRHSFLLNFAYAEAQEAAKNNAEVHATFAKFIEVLHGEVEKAEKIITPDNSFSSNGSAVTQPALLLSSSSSSVAPQKELARRRTELSIAWIMYMRFARRAEGLKPARSVFGKARKDKWISWEVYEAAGTLSVVLVSSVKAELSLEKIARFEKPPERPGDS